MKKIGIKVDVVVTMIDPRLLQCFFESIHANLEFGEWGSRFPALLLNLADNKKLDVAKAAEALREL